MLAFGEGEGEEEEGKNQLSMFVDNLYSYDHREEEGFIGNEEEEEEEE